MVSLPLPYATSDTVTIELNGFHPAFHHSSHTGLRPRVFLAMCCVVLCCFNQVWSGRPEQLRAAFWVDILPIVAQVLLWRCLQLSYDGWTACCSLIGLVLHTMFCLLLIRLLIRLSEALLRCAGCHKQCDPTAAALPLTPPVALQLPPHSVVLTEY